MSKKKKRLLEAQLQNNDTTMTDAVVVPNVEIPPANMANVPVNSTISRRQITPLIMPREFAPYRFISAETADRQESQDSDKLLEIPIEDNIKESINVVEKPKHKKKIKLSAVIMILLSLIAIVVTFVGEWVSLLAVAEIKGVMVSGLAIIKDFLKYIAAGKLLLGDVLYFVAIAICLLGNVIIILSNIITIKTRGTSIIGKISAILAFVGAMVLLLTNLVSTTFPLGSIVLLVVTIVNLSFAILVRRVKTKESV